MVNSMARYDPLGLPYKHGVLDGIPLTPVTPAARIKEIQVSHISRPDDVIIATYLKSGTSWLQQILCLMYDYPQGKDKTLTQNAPFLEAASKDVIDNCNSPRIMNSHLRYRWIPKAPGLKYIYCYRNPKDLVVSYYHHMKTMNLAYCYEGDMDNFVDNLFLAPNATENGSYFDHVAEWLALKGRHDIHYVTYEGLSANFEHEVKNIAKFLNMGLTEEKMELIKSQSTLTAMRSNDKTNFTWYDGKIKDPTKDFLRKGKVGDWKNYLSEEQSKRIEELVAEKLLPLGANILYEL